MAEFVSYNASTYSLKEVKKGTQNRFEPIKGIEDCLADYFHTSKKAMKDSISFSGKEEWFDYCQSSSSVRDSFIIQLIGNRSI